MTTDYTNLVNQQVLKDKLYAGSVLVSFKKISGERRDMRCTLNPAKLPAKEGSSTPRAAPYTSLAVFDQDASEWRSFRWDSIIEVKEA
jgi:hypothetical protein